MEKNDTELVAEYLAGNKEALKTLVSRYLKPVYNLAYRLSGNADEANDITQETFVKAWKNLKKFDRSKKFSTWIFAIARNSAIDWLRKKRPSLFSDMNNKDEDREEFEHGIPDKEILQDELFSKNETADLVEKTLEILPLNYRTIVILHNNNELTFEEIAEMLKKPMNTVKSQYRRALLMMRKEIEKGPHQNKPHNRIHNHE